jgi:hypothetical protein
MRLARIKNKYLYNGDNPNGWHWYLVYLDKSTRKYRLIQINHLYELDAKRAAKLQKGLALKEKLPVYEVPSLVDARYYDSDKDGQPIHLDNKNVVEIVKNHIAPEKAKRIQNFAQKRVKRKR